MECLGKPVKVIHMAPLSTGGISKLTITIHGLMDPQKVQFDYLVFRNQEEFLEKEAIALGGKKQVVNTEAINNKLVKFIKKMVWMKKLFKNEKYDVVHVDASTPYDIIVAIAAKMAGVKTIILHSHNNGYQKSVPLRDIFMGLYKKLMPLVVTDYFTISESAAEFMFPKKIVKEKKYKLVCNGIRTSDYEYDEQDRIKARKEMNLEGKFVIGHIGRFVYQKNHEFILKVFANIQKEHPESVLLLVGEGTLKSDIMKKVKELELEDSVIFYGVTHDIRRMLLVMDVFIFPSHFEGLGIAAIEAQTCGLHVYGADTIAEEVNVTECFHRIHGWDETEWAEAVWKGRKIQNRRSYTKEVTKAGYNIQAVARELETFYLDSQKS